MNFNKMYSQSGTVLNLKYTDATTQLRWRNLYNQYYDKQTQDKRNLTISQYSDNILNR